MIFFFNYFSLNSKNKHEHIKKNNYFILFLFKKKNYLKKLLLFIIIKYLNVK